VLQGERIQLRAPRPGDIDLYVRWLNDPEIWAFIQRHRPMGRPEEEEWFQNLHRHPENVQFVIELREGERAIGACGLRGIGQPHHGADLGIGIFERECWNRGLGGEAMELLCEYGFQALNLHRIGLSVYENNVRGQRCYQRVGFQLEGRRREARFWNGAYGDVLEMGLLASEWRERLGAARPEVREFCRRDA